MPTLFSIILPTRNRVTHLFYCLRTLQMQTYQDFEVILIDDASTDGTKQWAKKWLDLLKLSHVYLRNETNEGTGASYKQGLSYAKGDYVCLFSDDDEYMLHHLQLAKEFVNANPDVAWFHADSFIIREPTNEVVTHNVIDYSTHQNKQLLTDFSRGIFPTNGTIVYKRKVIEEVGGIRPLYYCEDFDLWLRLLKAGYPLHKRIGIPSYIYTDHKGKHITNPVKREADLEFALEAFYKGLEADSPLRDTARYYLLEMRLKHKLKAILRTLGV